MTTLLTSILRRVNSESSTIGLRGKQFLAAILPARALMGLKKRYYLGLLRKDSDELMEIDAKALPNLVKPGDFAIDVGAFVGFYTQRLSRLVGPTGMVWSFEPMPQTFEILVSAARRLGLTNVRFLPFAVSDREEATAMEIPRYRGGGESWWDARITSQAPHEPNHAFRQVAINTRTLDSLLAGTDRRVTFIKIDAEYHEYHCIRGATETLGRWHPVIQVETLGSVDDEGTELRAMVDLLGGLGYAPYRFDGTRFHLRQRGESQQNLFFSVRPPVA
jgi:FkbM family methyltransferase